MEKEPKTKEDENTRAQTRPRQLIRKPRPASALTSHARGDPSIQTSGLAS
ncbi:hypothetical protein SNOG_12823 [Parastagonospora nodorum SN15]|uniref:Uncharacterized protein n=1 Tax=Phaeosphaeria nodorum (strain SN15 / ATCC MYA-4574 / FGSC 10173) TaxID=321614 RepID=Q0U5Z1_PHANO|nr:hypothetical protein SNOG_12823 [Parastagonospora nodorum SN15]EAT79623.1 hypothetical protein SNOG_12823 [Parastagonospora nodorum SN15]